MEFLIILIAVAGIFLKFARKNIRLNPDEEWTPAKEVRPDIEDVSSISEPDDVPGAEDTVPEEAIKESVSENEPVRKHRPDSIPAPEAAVRTEEDPAFGTVPRPDVRYVYGLIGKPLSHSRSMILFKKKFHKERISADYCNFELDDPSEVRKLVGDNPRICGLNVTAPYKTDIIQYLDRLDDTAREIGAVNVIKVNRNGDRIELAGYNTDTTGFERSLRPILPETPLKALVLGTGGASKAVCHALTRMGIGYDIVSRSSGFDIMGYYELSPSVMEAHQLIINCTPLGTSPDTEQCPDIPYAYITSDHILFDLVYNPETTLFMKKGMEHGACVKNGSEMLQIQAEEAWKIWNE